MIENTESRERALAVLRTLDELLAPLFQRLPEGCESAIQFSAVEEEE